MMSVREGRAGFDGTVSLGKNSCLQKGQVLRLGRLSQSTAHFLQKMCLHGSAIGYSKASVQIEHPSMGSSETLETGTRPVSRKTVRACILLEGEDEKGAGTFLAAGAGRDELRIPPTLISRRGMS